MENHILLTFKIVFFSLGDNFFIHFFHSKMSIVMSYSNFKSNAEMQINAQNNVKYTINSFVWYYASKFIQHKNIYIF